MNESTKSKVDFISGMLDTYVTSEAAIKVLAKRYGEAKKENKSLASFYACKIAEIILYEESKGES